MSLDSGQWHRQGEFLPFRSHRLFARSGGVGAPLLLIHGFPTSSYDWAHLWPSLVGNHQVHAIDMLGFGASDKPRSFPYSLTASADQWQMIAAARSLTRVDILAHDYGNTVAQELLARQNEGRLPFQIDSVTFLNGGLFPEATYPILLQRLLLGPIGPLLARLSSYRSFASSMRRICAKPASDAELREHWRLLCRADGKLVLPKLIRYIRERRENRERWVGALQQAAIPLCLIDGIEDPISGTSIVRRWRELLPESRVIELDGIGHYPQIEDPVRVLVAFQAFLDEQS
jgi:pimeloyl-ACP methyl ester carboxylesterase